MSERKRHVLPPPEPSPELPRVGGAPARLETLLEGARGAVLVFWSAVCSHCRRYDDYLNALARRDALRLAVIGCRAGESLAELESARAERGLDFPLLHDRGELARAWGVRQTPTAFLLDLEHPKSRVLYRGAIDDFSYPGTEGHRAYLDEAIRAFLDGRPVELASTSAFGCPTESVYYRLDPTGDSSVSDSSESGG